MLGINKRVNFFNLMHTPSELIISKLHTPNRPCSTEVGDPWQAIYGFTGASTDAAAAMQRDDSESKPNLPRFVTFRAPPWCVVGSGIPGRPCHDLLLFVILLLFVHTPSPQKKDVAVF